MQKLRFAVGVFGVAVLLSGAVVLACGDKLLAIRRGVRFQRAYAPYEANVLIYANGNQKSATFSAKLQAALKQAGHKVQTVQGASQLDEPLRLGKVDVVLADFSDIAAITRQLQSAPSKPIVLPILFKPSKAEIAAVQKEYKVAVKAPADEVQYLTAINEVMKLRLRIGAKS